MLKKKSRDAFSAQQTRMLTVTGEMAQPARCLPRKHEDLTSIHIVLTSQVRSQDCNGRDRKIPRDCRPTCLACSASPGQLETCLNKGGRLLRKNPRGCPLTSTCMLCIHMHLHTHKHACTKIIMIYYVSSLRKVPLTSWSALSVCIWDVWSGMTSVLWLGDSNLFALSP